MLQRTLATFRRHGVTCCAMEVSSHAIDQGRVDGTAFRVMAFTNLSDDHLDYHESMEGYFATKAAMFTPERTQIAVVDIDDTIVEVHGYAKQGAAFGYSGVRGLNIQLATISTPTAAPVIARARLRKGNTASATGAGRLLAQAITTAHSAGVKGQILARADSAYYGWAFVGTALRHKTWFSVTARMNPSVVAAITSIDQRRAMLIESAAMAPCFHTVSSC